jgi:hypothetical protein
MTMNDWLVELLEDPHGRKPVERWLDSLSVIKGEAAKSARI